MNSKHRLLSWACLFLLASNLLLVVLSWIFSATGTLIVRSLISSEGLRWFMGHYVDIILSPLLAWMLLAAVAYSCCKSSGLARCLCSVCRRDRTVFRQRLALRVTVLAFLIILLIVTLLLLSPHAVLLSPVGTVFPSPFSRSIVPLLAGTVTLLSIIYGILSGAITTIESAFRSLYCHIPHLLPFFILYIFAAQLYACLLYVF